MSDTVGVDKGVILVNASGGIRTVTLPDATLSGMTGRLVFIKKVDSSDNNVVVAAASGQTIDGAADQQIYLQYESMTVVCDGTNWYIL